jgi:Mg2+-importing ATPase
VNRWLDLPGQTPIPDFLMVIVITLAVPFSPVAGLLGFNALTLQYLLTNGVIVLAYLGFAEVTKTLYYQRVSLQ